MEESKSAEMNRKRSESSPQQHKRNNSEDRPTFTQSENSAFINLKNFRKNPTNEITEQAEETAASNA